MGIKLPEYQPTQRSQGLPSNGFSTKATPEAFGAGIGRAVGDVANVLAEQAKREQDKSNLAAVEAADNATTQWSIKRQSEALNQLGKDAFGLPDKVLGEYDEFVQSQRQNLANDAQRVVFDKQANQRRASMQLSLLRHESGQMDGYADTEHKSFLALRAESAGANYTDPARVQEERNKSDGALRAYALRKGIDTESDTFRALKLDQDSAINSAVMSRLIDDDPYKARDWLNRNRSSMSLKDAEKFDTVLKPAIERADGIRLADQVSKLTLPEGKGFDRAVNLTMRLEGGYVANDAGKGETNMGINKTANPDVNVRDLTPEQAKALYRERYWNAIGADKLSPAMQVVAFDAAVNHGPSATAKMLAAAGGDPGKLIELRRDEYQRLLKQNPQKYGKYAKAWESRLQQVEAAAAVPEGGSNEAALIRMAESAAPSKKAGEIAVKELKDRFASDKARRAEESSNRYIAASEIAFTQGWRAVPPRLWGELDDSQRAKLMAGPPKSSDLDTLLELDTKPELRVKGKIEQFRHLLTPADYQRYYAMGNGPDKALSAAVDAQQLNQVLLQTGMWKLAGDPRGMNDADKQEKVRLVASLEQMIDAEQRAKKRLLSMDEKNAIYRTALKEVTIRTRTTGSFLGLGDGPSEDTRRAFQVQNPRNIKVPGEVRQRIVAFLKGRGIPVSESNIIEAYLDLED
jgi:lysozyme family protein